MIGVRIGTWLIDAEIGRGGMGAVYRAIRTTPGPGPDLAAVKVLAAELAVEAGFRQRFDREIQILRKLEHSHIVRFYESGDQGGRHYYFMEYVPGPNYEQLLMEHGKLPWPDVLTLALQIAPALKHAHDRGIVHRDLKPANILQTPVDPGEPNGPWQIKLADFGIASLFASPHLTVTGGVIGTPEYLSPEQASSKPITRRSDLYSLGAVLYALITGRPPFEGDPVGLLHKHLYGQFERPSRLIPELPPDFEEIICQLLEKDPSRRFADAGVLTRRLESFRKKLERKAAGALEELKQSERSARERADGVRVGPATLMSRLMRQHLHEEARGGPTRQLLHHPVILLVLFFLTAGGIAWAFWPLAPETMFQRGAALMASEDPDDWDRAWEKYLGPLTDKYPETGHEDELAELRRKYQTYQSERAAARAVRLIRPQSEAEWFYYLGLRLRRRGDEAEARRVWRKLADAFRDTPAERPWVRKAEQELNEPPSDQRQTEQQWRTTSDAIQKVKQLKEEGKQGEASAMEAALRELYREDAGAQRLLSGLNEEGKR